MVLDRAISMKFLTHRVSGESTGDFFPKIIFPPFLVATLNFCVKCEKTVILITVQDLTQEDDHFCYAKIISFSLAKQYSSYD